MSNMNTTCGVRISSRPTPLGRNSVLTHAPSRPRIVRRSPALSASLLNAGPDELRRDLKTYGKVFESLALRDLRVHAQPSGATVHHYLDSTGLEVDFVVDGGYGRWGAVEVKLGADGGVLDRAAATLKTFAARVDSQSSGEPRFLAVLTAGGHAYTRPDGVCVIPLGALRP